MTKCILFISVICGITNFYCTQAQTRMNLSKVEIDPKLKDDFFNSKSYSRSPSSMQMYRNDTLVLDTTYSSVREQEVNAFLEDQYHKKFGLDKCFATFEKDTVLIEFRNVLIENQVLSIKIFKDHFYSIYTENDTTLNIWTPTKERLILNSKDFKKNQEVKGLLEIEFLLSKNGVKKDSVSFRGPFYYTIGIAPGVRTVATPH